MKSVSRWLLIFCILIVLTLLTLLINQKYAKCLEGHTFNEDMQKCQFSFSSPEECQETYQMFVNTMCYYSPRGFLNNTYLWFILGFFILVSIIIITVVIASKKKKVDFKKEILDENIARGIWEIQHARQYNLPLVNNVVPEGFITWLPDKITYPRPLTGEYFLKQEVLVINCGNVMGDGLFTVIIPLSGGIDMAKHNRTRQMVFDEFAYKPQLYPEVSPVGAEEKIMQFLQETSPEAYQQMKMQQLLSSQQQKQQQPQIQQGLPPEQYYAETGQPIPQEFRRQLTYKRRR